MRNWKEVTAAFFVLAAAVFTVFFLNGRMAGVPKNDKQSERVVSVQNDSVLDESAEGSSQEKGSEEMFSQENAPEEDLKTAETVMPETAVAQTAEADGTESSETNSAEAVSVAETKEPNESSKPAEPSETKTPSKEPSKAPEPAKQAHAVSDYAIGDYVEDEVVYALGKDSFFSQTKLNDKLFDRIYGKSFGQDCTIPREDLRYLCVLYYDFNGKTCFGELICNKAISQDLVEIFRELYENNYPIEKIRLVDDYGADDDKSSSDNNTSCFNFRTVPGKTSLSLHAKGLAIDINPKYNPYVVRDAEGNVSCLPANGSEYMDRTKEFSYKIDQEDLCYRLFTEHGFTWGGSWENEPDYMHFSKSATPES